MMPDEGGRLLPRATPVASPNVQAPASEHDERASASSAAVANRNDGSFSSARMATLSTSAGMGRPSRLEGDAGRSWTWAKISAPARVGLEGRPAAEQEVQDGAEPIDVQLGVRILADRDFGRDVRRGSEHAPRVRHASVSVDAANLRDPEVEHLHEIVFTAERGEKQVLRLDVAVHDSALVRLAERARGLTDDVHGARRATGARGGATCSASVSPSSNSIT